MKRDVAPVLFGVAVSTVLAGALTIPGLKAGITPGVSPLVILVAWGVFVKAASGAGGTRFLNLTQVAGSAGMAVTAGVIFTAPLVQILFAEKQKLDPTIVVPGVDVVTLIVLSLAGAFIGFGFVGLTTRKFLSDPTLPAPEARACEVMIESAVTEAAKRPRMGPSLGLGMLAGVLAPLFASIGLAAGKLKIFALEEAVGKDERSATLALPFSPIYIGIGGLLTLGTALLVFGGSFIRLIGDMLLVGQAGSADFPGNSMRWVGGAAMTVAVAYSLFKFLKIRLPVGADVDDAEAKLIEVDPPRRKRQWISVGIGFAIMIAWLFTSGAPAGFAIPMAVTIFVMAMLMVALGAILSLQIGSSASPVSGTIFVTTLVLCLVALATGYRELKDVIFLTPLLVGACVAVCTANDSSQDYKTLQLCGVRVQDGFLAQILGLIGGCIVVPIVLYVAYEAYGFGNDAMPAPQGQMFATLIGGLLLEGQLPLYPILIGLALGGGAVALDVIGRKKGHQLPSMALAVGIYLPAAIGIGILIGSGFRRLAEGKGRKQRNESILAAAGLITGSALMDLFLGVLVIFVAGFDPEKSLMFLDLPMFVTGALCLVGILGIGWILWSNSKIEERGEA